MLSASTATPEPLAAFRPNESATPTPSSYRAAAGKVIAALWIAAIIYVLALSALIARGSGARATMREPVLEQVILLLLWGIATPAIIWSAGKRPIDRTRWRSRVVTHTAIAIAFIFAINIVAPSVAWVMLGRPSPFSVVWHHGLEQFIAAAHLALIVYAFILGAGHYLRAMVIRRQEQLRAERLRADLASAQLRALTLQLQPHFLFNALNAVGALIITERNREAFEVIGRLGELLRGLLATERREEVSLREELELAESYVGIERARLGERLRVTWDVAPDIGSAQLPPMLLQPLVENAIRHGVSKSPAGGCLTIHAWRDETRLAIDVADDGPGFPTQTDEMHESRHPGTERCSRARGRRRTARTGWLRAILREEHGLSIVGESSGGAEAIAAIEALSPDLVFLDIALPDLDGFDVVDRIRTDRRPAIVFVTAHSDQALRAFETRALDYVTKPIRRERVREAVARARERIRLERLDRQPAPPSAAPMDGPLALKIDAKVQLIDQQSIDWVEADDDHVVVHCGDRLWRARETLREAAGRLDPTRFVQIHRSTVVRLGAVRELQSWFHGDYIVILHSGAKLRLSRSFRDAVASRLGRAL